MEQKQGATCARVFKTVKLSQQEGLASESMRNSTNKKHSAAAMERPCRLANSRVNPAPAAKWERRGTLKVHYSRHANPL
jgi:hypothetical protein